MASALTRLHRAWWIVAITFLTLLSAAAFRSTTGVMLLPLETEFGWSRSLTSGAVALHLLVYGLTAPFAATLIERFSMRRVVSAALLLVSLGLFLTTLMTQSWQLVLLWGLFVGFGTGCLALVFGAAVANRWFVARRGLVTGVFSAGYATGSMIFLPLLTFMIEGSGWRSASLTVAVFSAVLAPIVYLFLRDRPSDVGLLPYGATQEVDLGPAAPATARGAIEVLLTSMRHPAFWVLAFTFFVCGWSTNGLIGTHFIPAAHDHGMPATTAASLLAIIGIFDLIGTIGSGYLTDKVSSIWLLAFFYGMRGLALLTIPVVLGPDVNPPLIFFIVFYGLDWIATVPPTVQLCREYFGVARSGVVYGWVFAFHMIGAAIAASFAGWIRESNGDYEVAWYVAAILCLIAAASVFLLKKIPTLAQRHETELITH
jgi:sugar phosphate permease